MASNGAAESTDVEIRLDNFVSDDFSNDRRTVSGKPQLGNVVQVEYKTSRGTGTHEADVTRTIEGEIVYVEVGENVIEKTWDGTLVFVVHDFEKERPIMFKLTTGSGSANLRTLTQDNSKQGQSLGKLAEVRFTDEESNQMAPIASTIREVDVGDTIFLNNQEFGVYHITERGPEWYPTRYHATLYDVDGNQHNLRVDINANPEFGVNYKTQDSHSEALDVDTVRPGRDHTETDTTEFFPAPHGLSEGDTVFVSIEDSEPEEVEGIVTQIKYFGEVETIVRLSDGRKVNLYDKGPRRISVREPSEDDVSMGDVEWYYSVEISDNRITINPEAEDDILKAD